MIGLVASTARGRRQAERLAGLWPDAKLFDGAASTALPEAWAECSGIVAFLSVGATVRLLAPHLADKHADPGVVCVDEGGQWAVAVLGAHGGDANALAARVSAVLGTTPVVTTATDSVGLNALDRLGWPVEGPIASVARAMLDGAEVRLSADQVWPLPPLPVRLVPYEELVAPGVVVSDRLLDDLPSPCVCVRPPSLVLGIGASRNAPADEIEELISRVLDQQRLSPLSVFAVATVDAKADEVGILEVCDRRGWTLTTYSAEALAGIDVPNPSSVVEQAVGTPSVAEAGALLHAGSGASLVAPKQASAMATVAVARRRPRGRLTLVGLGPGARDLLPPRAAEALAYSGYVVGLDQYVAQVRDLIRPGAVVLASALGQEEERAQTAVDLAREGNAVALIGSGDAGVYAMASPALEMADDSFDVVGVPGITAALAAAALLGAPLGHDHAAISLSDLHTPWAAIERRVRAAAEGDFVVTFYNPRSRGRDHQLPDALEILRAHRPPTTPVGLVRDASRPGQQVVLTTLQDVRVDDVDMLTVVVVGSSQTVEVAGRMVTPGVPVGVNPSYPLLLRLEDKPVLVVGAGPVAARRARAMVDAGAQVRVVAPIVGPAVGALADEGRLVVEVRAYNPGDLDGVWLVHACTDDPAVNAGVAADAEADRVFCVRADDREASAAWVPAVHRQGDVVVAVNAGGVPARAKALRDQIAEALVAGSEPAGQVTASDTGAARPGMVHLVGAGPGDPGLLTVRALEVLGQADVVLVDRLVDRAVIAHVRAGAEVIDVGKRGWATKAGEQQFEIERLLVEHARAGKRVVRLKGGDPFVFGRGGEEALACTAAGVPFDVVPGVSSAIAVPSYAGIPVTHRGVTHDVAVLSGHLDPDDPASQVRWRAHAESAGTLVVLMGLANLAEVCSTLVAFGRAESTPAASIARGTTPAQQVVVSDLANLAADVEAAHLPSPVVTVIGDVVRLREQMRWYAGEVET